MTTADLTATEPLPTQLRRIETTLNHILSILAGLAHAPKCDQPGEIVTSGDYAIISRCKGCGAVTTRKKDSTIDEAQHIEPMRAQLVVIEALLDDYASRRSTTRIERALAPIVGVSQSQVADDISTDQNRSVDRPATVTSLESEAY
jgi:hypothetical protein